MKSFTSLLSCSCSLSIWQKNKNYAFQTNRNLTTYQNTPYESIQLLFYFKYGFPRWSFNSIEVADWRINHPFLNCFYMKSPNPQEAERGPNTLIRYEPAVEIYQSMRSYHLQKYTQEGATNLRHQEIIESIIPPRQWTDHANKLHIQYASHHPASRDDVVELTNTLDKMLIDRQARLKGICAIRQQLYSQTFDEMIRQVAVDCPERGLLLMRVRDEHKMTLAAYQTVYQSSIGYGIQKQVESEEGTDHLEQEYSRLQGQKQALEERKMHLLCEKELLQKELKENKALESEQREDELHFLRVQTENMTKFIDSIRIEIKHQ